ncbi:hypothetical protein Pmani_002889 [Petrolisthes manimaculis]|uniref:Uncharacterized protein n=1 Tax=Petrolisthes manimaculis TaxID=1843537 RepID=A0AAE1QHR8_9EUCA|nr:hypothetical protein Pmani_002889 [Petrolisthes manimaculis]
MFTSATGGHMVLQEMVLSKGVVSNQVTEIDGVPRHIRDIRHRIPPQHTQNIRSNSSDASVEDILMTFSAQDSPGLDQAIDGSDEDADGEKLRRSQRTRKPRLCLSCI